MLTSQFSVKCISKSTFVQNFALQHLYISCTDSETLLNGHQWVQISRVLNQTLFLVLHIDCQICVISTTNVYINIGV